MQLQQVIAGSSLHAEGHWWDSEPHQIAPPISRMISQRNMIWRGAWE
jgi:hypothetical protein